MSEVINIKELNERIERESVFVDTLRNEMGKVIVGQSHLVDTLLIGLLSNGHILLEGVPGLAKTLAITTLAKAVDACFSRIQFTPDLLPADLIGTLIYSQKNEDFVVRKGPIFANFVLADEINRSPAKVQSALLEAMQERQVTIGDNTYPLPQPFLVLATQNPLEQEGTYPLPEAQVDRFMLKAKISYPKKQEERDIVRMNLSGAGMPEVGKVITPEDIVKARKVVEDVYMDEKIEKYIIDIIFATREPAEYNLQKLQNLIAYGGSPRASISLAKAARAYAFIRPRGRARRLPRRAAPPHRPDLRGRGREHHHRGDHHRHSQQRNRTLTMQETENDILKRVRKIEIKTRGLSNEIFAGKYHTAFRGRGMSFSEVREYRAGDDVRDIDWNVTARSRKPHIKVYEEERELTMMLLVDVSASRMFGSTDRLKKNIITEIAAVLAFSAAQNNDKVGCIFFSDRVEKFIPPKKGRSHILMIIRELIGFRPESAGTKLSEPVRFLTNVNKKRCTTFILSDFMDSTGDKSALDDALKIAGSKHDLVGIRVYDPRETELPDVGIVELKDAESGRKVWVDTSSRAVRDHYAASWQRRSGEIEATLKHNRIDTAMISTDGDYVAELIKLFKQR